MCMGIYNEGHLRAPTKFRWGHFWRDNDPDQTQNCPDPDPLQSIFNPVGTCEGWVAARYLWAPFSSNSFLH
jgi:hypothetical protein